MSIATAITQLQQAKEDIADAITAKGVPTTGHGLSDFPTDIAAIPSGGGGMDPDVALLLVSAQEPASAASAREVLDLRQGHASDFSQIGEYAFYKTTFKKVLLPQSIRTVKAYAFAYCNRLEECLLPDAVTTVENFIFYNCSSLAKAATPVLGQRMFYNNFLLSDLTIPQTITAVPAYCFYNCQNLDLADQIGQFTSIGENGFYGSGITVKRIPGTVTQIINAAFQYCRGITEIDLGGPNTVVSPKAFMQCPNLVTAKIRAGTMGVGTVSQQIFGNCTALTNVWISEDCITMLASGAMSAPFYGCNSLTDIYCEHASQPAGWSQYWAYISTSTQATVHWGVSESDFDNLIA